MAVQSVTLNIPQPIYEQIRRAAEKKHRSIDDVLVEALTAVAPVLETASTDLQSALAHMAYLNDAALSNLNEVLIIHGIATGTVRQITRDFLASHPLVKSFRAGGQGEGGDGATVVSL